ncbi:hypothetical protein BJ166DRAFT_501402 [Pestalotiopsis sp. NC0098]|nr:hypothetical protein BJ166DRAFT_501402 [Pestalotiopsis sp. NC0098]
MNNSKVVAETHTVDEYNPPRPIIHHEHHERCPPSLDRLPSRTGLDHDITSTQDHSMTENVEPTAAVLQQQPREAGDNKILILGPTGVGKSSFISLMTGCNVPIGHDIISCFDDSSRDDMEILGSIAKYLVKDDRSSITGIIYIQRITDRKMTGTSVLNLKILKRLCGEHFYPSVALVSSMWNSIPNDRINRQCETREHRLIDSEFWGDMVSGGSKTFRFEGDRASGLRIIKHFTGNNHDHMSVPQFVRELLTKSTLESTSAGQMIVEERMRREQKRLEEIEEEMQCVKSQKAEYQEEIQCSGGSEKDGMAVLQEEAGGDSSDGMIGIRYSQCRLWVLKSLSRGGNLDDVNAAQNSVTKGPASELA